MTFTAETVFYIVLEILIGFAALIGNSVVCYIILNNDNFRKTPMYMFVMSLALADIFVGLIVAPFGVLTKLGLPYNNPLLCITMITFIIIPTLISIYSLTAVSIERYVAIRYPIFHLHKVTKNSSIFIIILIWILCALLGLLPVFGWNTIGSNQQFNEPKEYLTHDAVTQNVSVNEVIKCNFVEVVDPDYLVFVFVIAGIFPLSVCAILYLLIYIQVLKLKKRLVSRSSAAKLNLRPKNEKRFESASSENPNETQISINNMSTKQETFTTDDESRNKKVVHTSKNPKAKEIRIATVLGLTVLAFAICWLPLHILNTITRFNQIFISEWVFSVAILLSHANSAINVFLYSWRIQAFKRDLNEKIIKRLFCR